MHGTICTQQWNHDSQNAHNCRETIATPAAVVVECGEHFGCLAARTQNPESYQDTEKAEDVQNQHDTLNQRKPFHQESVEEDGEGRDGKGKECSVPFLWNIVGVVEDDQTLDLSTR